MTYVECGCGKKIKFLLNSACQLHAIITDCILCRPVSTIALSQPIVSVVFVISKSYVSRVFLASTDNASTSVSVGESQKTTELASSRKRESTHSEADAPSRKKSATGICLTLSLIYLTTGINCTVTFIYSESESGLWSFKFSNPGVGVPQKMTPHP